MMYLKNGKFYENGKVVPVEFGNKEQIRLIREAEKTIEALSGDGLAIEAEIEEETTYNASYYFKCVCGNRIEEHSEADDEDDFSGLLEDKTCRECKRKYTVGYANKHKNRQLIAKLKES